MADDETTGDSQPEPPDDSDGGQTFDEEDVNRIVRKRLHEDRQRREREYGDLDELAEKAEKFDELRAERQSELENAQERAAEAETQLEQLRERMQLNQARSAVIEAAADAGARDLDAVWRLIDQDVLERDEDGNITNAEQAVQTLLEERDYLQAGQPAGSADQGPRDTAQTPGLDETDDPDEVLEQVRGLRS